MTNLEFSNEFDTLVNSFSTSETFGKNESPLKFDEYEKSVFLTKAQESIVISLYNGKLLGDSFEEKEEVRRYLDGLIKTTSIPLAPTATAKVFTLPTNLMFITYETVTLNDTSAGCYNNKEILVTPVTQDEYFVTKENPFRGPNKRRALRLDAGDNKVEIVSKYNVSKYNVKYLSKPEPIILIKLPDALKINNTQVETECKLNSALHRPILEMAVSLALQSRNAGTK